MAYRAGRGGSQAGCEVVDVHVWRGVSGGGMRGARATEHLYEGEALGLAKHAHTLLRAVGFAAVYRRETVTVAHLRPWLR